MNWQEQLIKDACPIAVLISDVHYSLPTLTLANAAMGHAIDKANELRVPLIVAGDLHDSKANMRAECVNAMIETFKRCELKATIMVGNHDKINEKSSDHALNFLEEHVNFIVDKPKKFSIELEDNVPLGYLIPYQHDLAALKTYLKSLPKGSQLIMHQGLQGSLSGEYIKDSSALSPEDVAGFMIISGHYHARQRVHLPDGGTWDYIGNPYSLNFGEAYDPPKGYQILFADGSLKHVPTNLRGHFKSERNLITGDMKRSDPPQRPYTSEDLLLVKVTGTTDQLYQVDKNRLAAELTWQGHIKLELIPVDLEIKEQKIENKTPAQVLDGIINDTNETEERKERLKLLAKSLL